MMVAPPSALRDGLLGLYFIGGFVAAEDHGRVFIGIGGLVGGVERAFFALRRPLAQLGVVEGVRLPVYTHGLLAAVGLLFVAHRNVLPPAGQEVVEREHQGTDAEVDVLKGLVEERHACVERLGELVVSLDQKRQLLRVRLNVRVRVPLLKELELSNRLGHRGLFPVCRVLQVLGHLSCADLLALFSA